MIPTWIKEKQSEYKRHLELAALIKGILEAECRLNGHKMKDAGHDSHYAWEECEVCGVQERK